MANNARRRSTRRAISVLEYPAVYNDTVHNANESLRPHSRLCQRRRLVLVDAEGTKAGPTAVAVARAPASTCSRRFWR